MHETPSMTMLKLKRSQLTVLTETLRDAANVAAGALIFGQALSEENYSLALAIVGLCAWLVLVGSAVVLASLGE